MNRSYLFILLFLACLTAQAQTDTIYVVKRNGVEAHFAFKKAGTLAQMRNYPPAAFPVYSMTRTQHNRMRDLLYTFVEMESNFTQLQKTYFKQDSLFKIKEATLKEAYQTQELRATNFENSYQNLLSINSTLDTDLKKCEQLAKAEHKKKNRKSIVVGALAAAAGLLIGAVAF